MILFFLLREIAVYVFYVIHEFWFVCYAKRVEDPGLAVKYLCEIWAEGRYCKQYSKFFFFFYNTEI